MGTCVLTIQLFQHSFMFETFHNKMSKNPTVFGRSLVLREKGESSFKKRGLSIPPFLRVIWGMHEFPKGGNEEKFSVH